MEGLAVRQPPGGNTPDHKFGTAEPARFSLLFGRIPVNQQARGVIQTKLAINSPGDEYEQEADKVSEPDPARAPIGHPGRRLMLNAGLRRGEPVVR
jgi:hypothetical protein